MFFEMWILNLLLLIDEIEVIDEILVETVTLDDEVDEVVVEVDI